MQAYKVSDAFSNFLVSQSKSQTQALDSQRQECELKDNTRRSGNWPNFWRLRQ